MNNKIRQFIKEHWKPEFVCKELPNGMYAFELNILGKEITQKELVDGILFPLTMIHNITPQEATNRFLRDTVMISELIGFKVDIASVKMYITTQLKETYVNKIFLEKETEYNVNHPNKSIMDWFSDKICDKTKPDNIAPILKDITKRFWSPFVYQDPTTKKFKISYIVGDIISEIVYQLNCSHDEATNRFANAVKKVNDELKFDADAHYMKQVNQHGIDKYTVNNLQADFEYFIAFHVLTTMTKDKQKTDNNVLYTDKNPLLKLFYSGLLRTEKPKEIINPNENKVNNGLILNH